ncbi:MAG: tetratricopeptide repeat protein [Myxococcota bacterium]
MPKKIKKRTKRKDEEAAEELEDDVLDASFYDEDAEDTPPLVVPTADSDALGDAGIVAQNYVEKNLPTILGVLTVGALVAIAVVVGQSVLEAQAVAAADSVTPVFQAYGASYEGDPQLKALRAREGFKDPKTIYASPEAKWKAVDEAADTAKPSVALPGKLANAAAALHLGKFEDAASLYDEALADPKIGHLEPFAVYGKSVALAGKGDTDKALEALNTLAKIDDEYAELAMYKKGTMLEATGDIEGAKEVYHELLEQKPNSAYKLDVERRLATL